MNKEIGCIYFLICFSLAIFVIVPILNNSAFGFLQITDTASFTNAIAANSTNAIAANSTNATAANSSQVSKPVQITSSETKAPTVQITPNTKTPTNGPSVIVDLQIKPFPVSKNDDTQFKIIFRQPSTQSVQVHVDWNFVISKMNKVVYDTATAFGQPVQHTAAGIVFPTYKFQEGGEYLLKITVVGINFIPITPEEALFNLKVS
ncbi:MAG TPA: hypothetical protein VI146_05810 [Nitrososphaeraceae archaeon]